MTKRLVMISALAAFTLTGASAIAQTGGDDNDGYWSGFSSAETDYLRLYEKAHAQGLDVGRNLLDYAWTDSEPVSATRLAESTERLKLWLNPPPAPDPVTSEPVSDPATYAAPATPAPVASSGGCPSSMYAESGSAGYSAYNPSSGATGCYQIIPSTAAAHGCDLSTPGGQDACAAEICATQGSGAWAASGANPC